MSARELLRLLAIALQLGAVVLGAFFSDYHAAYDVLLFVVMLWALSSLDQASPRCAGEDNRSQGGTE